MAGTIVRTIDDSTKKHIIFAFSDTYGYHRDMQVPKEADILICAGDAVEDDLKGGEYDDFAACFHPSRQSGRFLCPAIMNCRLAWGESII